MGVRPVARDPKTGKLIPLCEDPGVQKLNALSVQYKADLIDVYHAQHVAEIDLRNEFFPELYAACVAHQASRSRWIELDRAISKQSSAIGYLKKLKKDAKESGTVLADYDERAGEASTEKKALVDARNKYKAETVDALYADVVAKRRVFNDRKAAFFAARKAVSDQLKAEGVGPNSSRRKEARWPTYAAGSFEARFEEIRATADAGHKALRNKYQKLGLHEGTRGKIDKDVKDIKDTGLEYRPRMKPVKSDSFVLQFKKQKGRCFTLADLVIDKAAKWESGRWSFLVLKYLGHGQGKRDDSYLYAVRQNIGTAKRPVYIEYQLMMHRRIPENAELAKWTLRLNGGRPYVSPIFDHAGMPRKTGNCVFTCDYSFGRLDDDGNLVVCYLLGDHINEELILPAWLVAKFEACAQIDEWLAGEAKKFFEALGKKTKGCAIRAIYGLIAKYENHGEGDVHDYNRAVKWIAWYHSEKAQREKLFSQAARARDNIYLTAAARVARLHSHWIDDPMNIAEGKRKQSRDKAVPDVLPDIVRSRAFYAAPGKIRKAFRKKGLIQDRKIKTENSSRTCQHCRHVNLGDPKKLLKCAVCGGKWDRDFGACLEHLARAGVDPKKYSVARKTDVVTSYIKSLGVKTGPVPYYHKHPSWTQPPTLGMKRLRETG